MLVNLINSFLSSPYSIQLPIQFQKSYEKFIGFSPSMDFLRININISIQQKYVFFKFGINEHDKSMKYLRRHFEANFYIHSSFFPLIYYSFWQ